MPQASEHLRSIINKWFGNPVDDSGPMRVLELRGWTLTKNWHWQPPTPNYNPSEIDITLIQFMMHEWDFGGIVGAADWEIDEPFGSF